MSEKRQTTSAGEQSAWLFLGYDLRNFFTFWREGWAEALRLPWLSWLNPSQDLLVHSADGTVLRFKNGHWLAANGEQQAVFHAILLPDAILLRRSLSVPRLSVVELQQLLSYELEAASPFGVAQTVWGYRIVEQTTHGAKIELLMTARAQVDQVFSQISADRPLDEYELWGMGADRQPVVFLGFGAPRRARYAGRQLMQRVAMLLVLPVLVLLLFVPPVFEARTTLQHAEAAYQVLQNKAGALEQKRGLIQGQQQSLVDVIQFAKSQPQALAVLNLLSEKIPDSAFITRFSINPQRVAISGQADNAAALMQVLGDVPSISNVRAPSAITRMPGSAKELFALEFNVDLEPKS